MVGEPGRLASWPLGTWARARLLQAAAARLGWAWLPHKRASGGSHPYCDRWDGLRQGAALALCLRRRDKTALQGACCARQALNGFPFTRFGLGPRLLKTSCPCPRSLPAQADLIAILAALPPSVTLVYGEFSLLKTE